MNQKFLLCFCNVNHNSADYNAFGEAVKMISHTGTKSLRLKWKTTSSTGIKKLASNSGSSYNSNSFGIIKMVDTANKF